MAKASGVPMMITQDMERRLRESGLEQPAIDKMTPQQAHDRLAAISKEGANGDTVPDAAKDKVPSRTRHRSPNFPFIGLERAIEQARTIYGADRLREIPLRVACQRWSFKLGGSQADQTVGALRAFGLIEVSGTGDNRMLGISERAYRILGGAIDAGERIKDAALSPSIHAEMWQRFGVTGSLPEDDVIRHYLVFDREAGRFTPESAETFIARFRETVSFAKLDLSDIIRGTVLGGLDEGKQSKGNEGDGKVTTDNNQRQQNPSTPPPPPPGIKQAIFPSDTGDVVVRWPAVLSDDDYKDIEGWIDILKRNIKRSVKPSSDN